MKRRLGFLIGSFVLLLILFGVYQLFMSWTVPEDFDDEAPALDPSAAREIQRPDDRVGRDLYVENRDDEGRLRGIYRAARSQKLPDGSYLLIKPIMEMYQKDGRGIFIRADRGLVYAEQVAGGLDIRRANLTGNVSVAFEVPGPDRQGGRGSNDVIRIFVDQIDFDRELLTLYSDGPVRVFSGTMDIFGTGLTISWNEQPDELRVLRIDRGRYVAVYAVPPAMGIVMPGAEAGPAPLEPPTQPAAMIGPASVPGCRLAAFSVVGPAVLTAATATQPASAPSTRPTDVPISIPPSRPEKEQPANIYYAEFDGAEELINVDFGASRIHNMEKLGLRFEWERSMALRPGLETAATAPAEAAARTPDSGVTSAPQTAASRPATRPTGQRKDTMIITWSGPLVIRPVGHTPEPSLDRYQVSGRGERIILSEPRGAAVCSEFSFDNAAQTGRLTGSQGRPVWLAFAEGGEILCRAVRIDRSVGLTYLDGPGRMVQRADRRQMSVAQKAETAQFDEDALAGQIRWRDVADVRIERRLVAEPDGAQRAVEAIKDVTFSGSVELVRPEDETYVRCDKLTATMTRGRDGRIYPGECLAAGNVLARQGTGEVRSDELSIAFEQTPPAGETSENVRPSDRIRPVKLEADGNVRIADRRRDGDIIDGFADHLEGDLVKRTATLTGAPARISRGTSTLTGDKISLSEADESASVEGKGSLEFESNRDLNSTRLARPRPVKITWSKSMNHNGRSNLAVIEGDVHLATGSDEALGQKMRVLFAAPDDAGRRATDGGAGPARQRYGFDVEQLSGRQINLIIIEKDVVLRSRRSDEEGYVLRNLELTGQDLRIYPPQERMDVLGAGTLVVQDYRQMAETAGQTDRATPLGKSVWRPSQSGLVWRDSMQLRQRERTAVLSGQVRMSFRSGKEVVLAERLNARCWWLSMTEGRRTDMRCRKMTVKFAAPDEQEPSALDTDAGYAAGGPRLGDLELFAARGDVNLRDRSDQQTNQILGQRLTYRRETDAQSENRPKREVAVVHGSLPGELPVPANITSESRATGQSRSWSGESLTCYLRDGEIMRVVSGPVKMAGSR